MNADCNETCFNDFSVDCGLTSRSLKRLMYLDSIRLIILLYYSAFANYQLLPDIRRSEPINFIGYIGEEFSYTVPLPEGTLFP